MFEIRVFRGNELLGGIIGFTYRFIYYISAFKLKPFDEKQIAISLKFA